MKKALLALLLLLPLAGCAHQGGGYAGGGAGYFYDGECLYPDGCYRPGYFYYFDGTQTSPVSERARVTKARRTSSTRVVTRQPVSSSAAAGSISARSAPRASSPRFAPASSAHAGGRR
jgi:hypothetical protein